MPGIGARVKYTVVGQRQHEYELLLPVYTCIIAEMVQFVNVACARATAALVQALSHKALVAIPAPRNPGGGWRRETAGGITGDCWKSEHV